MNQTLFSSTNQLAALNDTERRKGVGVGDSMLLLGSITHHLNLTQCLALTSMSLELQDVWNSSYRDPEGANDRYQIDMSSIKNCYPGKASSLELGRSIRVIYVKGNHSPCVIER